MSLDIISRTIGGELDKKFVLRNHQCARILSIQDDWTRLRIGCRFALVDTGANIAGTPQFFFGLLSNPALSLTNGPLTASTSHFVGVRQTDATLSRSAGPPPFYALTTTINKKVGTAITAGTGGSGAWNLWADPANRRQPIIVEFTKGSPWTVQTLAPSNLSGDTDIDFSTITSAIEASTMANADSVLDAAAGGNFYSVISGTIAVDEGTDGPLNAVCMAWDRSLVQLEWSELLFAKFA